MRCAGGSYVPFLAMKAQRRRRGLSEADVVSCLRVGYLARSVPTAYGSDDGPRLNKSGIRVEHVSRRRERAAAGDVRRPCQMRWTEAQKSQNRWAAERNRPTKRRSRPQKTPILSMTGRGTRPRPARIQRARTCSLEKTRRCQTTTIPTTPPQCRRANLQRSAHHRAC